MAAVVGRPSSIKMGLSAIRAMLAAAEERLETERRDYAAAQIMVAEGNRAQKDTVLLNIGGEYFGTTISTLSREEGFLASMVKGVFGNGTDEAGAFFVDRDPTYFAAVLAYLRDPAGLVIPECPAQRKALDREANFYSLGGLRGRIRTFRPALVRGDLTFAADPGRLIITNNGHTVTRAPSFRELALLEAFCDLEMTTGRHRWSATAPSTTFILFSYGISSIHTDFGIYNDFGTYGLNSNGQVSGHHGPRYLPPLRAAEVVWVDLDLREGGGGGTVAFAVNDGPWGAAIPITHPGPFRPFFRMPMIGDSCSILSYQHDPDPDPDPDSD